MEETKLSPAAEKILLSIRSSDFASGEWTKADDQFEIISNELEALSNKLDEPLNSLYILLEITEKYQDNEHVIEGVLHIIGNLEGIEKNPVTYKIAKNCIENKSPVVQDLLISCTDKWSTPEALEILEKIEPEEKWLEKYKEQVLKELKPSDPEEKALQDIEKYRKAYETGAELPKLGGATIRYIINAVKRSIACLPNTKGSDELTIKYWCPNCSRYFGQRGKHSVFLFAKDNFCQTCGQKIFWKEEDI